jgi:uncharacterized protein
MVRRLSSIKLFLLIFSVLVDGYAYLALFELTGGMGQRAHMVWQIIFWSASLFILILLLILPRPDISNRNPAGISGLFSFFGFYILVYIPTLVFLAFRLTEDIIWMVSGLVSFPVRWITGVSMNPIRLPVISAIGLMLALVPFIAILWGLVMGRFHYQVEPVEVKFKDLPQSFDGLRIVQLSDIHLGSLYGKQKKVIKAVSMVNSLNPDLVLFTGDLVNNYSEEALGWENIFARIQARLGKFSILGNHDYGDYWDWNSEAERHHNMDLLYQVHAEMGFQLLRNAWDTVSVNGDRLALVGVENWGRPPFKQYGNLEKSLAGLPPSLFKILLSHDPSHWDAQVAGKTDIQLTLSGHTHAMQLGFRIGRFKWSPSSYIYKRWMGLYKNEGQALYVNRGMGYIGFPGRIGLRPEITLIVLRKSID